MLLNSPKLLLACLAFNLLILTNGWGQCWISAEGDYYVCPNTVTSYSVTAFYDDGTSEGCVVASVEGSQNWVDGAGNVHWGNIPGDYRMFFSCSNGCNEDEFWITVSPQEIAYSVSGGGTVCTGSQATINLSGSQVGLEYRLLRNGGFYSMYNGPQGGPISFTVSDAGTYTVAASEGCSYWGPNGESQNFMMSGSAVVSYVSPPSILSVQGGGSICSGSSSTIFMPSSQSGVNYELRRNDGQVVSTVSGTGGQITWTNISPPAGSWTYQVIASNAGCSRTMSGSPSVVMNAMPGVFTVGGGGSFCSGNAGVSVTLNGSQSGVNYQLRINNVNSGSPVGGTGGSLTWAGQTSAGTYTIIATNASSGCSIAMNGSAPVSVNPIPNQFAVGGGGAYCSGSGGVAVTLSGSQSGVNYQLQINGINTGSAVGGTGGILTWASQTSGGTYTVVASYPGTGCSRAMSGNASVTANPLPAQFNVGGGGTFCSGGSAGITLSGSQSGVNYQLQIGGSNTGAPLPGTGSTLLWANQITSGNYTVIATNASAGCTSVMNGSATITNNPLPVQYTVGGGGFYCSGGSVAVTLSGSQSGVSYQLRINGSNAGSAISGTGSPLTWSNQTAPGTYTVVATITSTGCSQPMSGSTAVSVNSLPVQFAVNGGGPYCSGGSGVAVGLSSSHVGVNYQLRINGSNTGSPVAGTGSPLSWPSQTTAGVYTVVATVASTTCTQTMSGSASVSINALPIQYTLSGGGAYCAGTNGVSIALEDSQPGVSYQLKVNGANSGTPLAGTDGALNWTNLTAPGNYTVVATNNANACSQSMNGNLNVSVITVTSIITGPSIIENTPITLAASTGAGYTYQWKMDGVNMPGKTLSALNVLESGNYQVEVTGSGCTKLSAMHYVEKKGRRYFNGVISSARWRTTKAHGTTGNDFKGMYTYTYDDKYQIKEAQWSTPDFATGAFVTGANTFKVSNLAYDPNGNILSLRRYDQNGARTNDFAYSYAANKNRLLDVTGHTSSSNPSGHGYAYNAIGQMTDQDLLAGNDQYIEYDVSGKVRKVFSNPARTEQYLKVEFLYDDAGFRLAKINHETDITTWYIRDASGSILSVYEENNSTHTLTQKEIPIYGAGKLGTFYPEEENEAAYEITDHLGNVRALMREVADVAIATLEEDRVPQEQGQFLHYDNARRVDATLFDHTGGTSTNYAARLNGSEDERIGLARSFAVQPGDRVFAEAYAKYVDPASENWTSALNMLITSIAEGTGPPGMVVDGPGYVGNGSVPFEYAGLLNTSGEGDAPQAYLNYLLFDANDNFIDGGFTRISTLAKENGSDVPHEKLELDITVNQTGYIYIYLSNESTTPVDVFFDDFKVTHTASGVVQATDYGVWGDVIREQKSDTSIYRFGYQGQFAEMDDETRWNHFELREYDPVIGRWLVPDPRRVGWSPYVGMGNDPVNLGDPDGGSPAGDCDELCAWLRGGGTLLPAVEIEASRTGGWPTVAQFFNEALTYFEGTDGGYYFVDHRMTGNDLYMWANNEWRWVYNDAEAMAHYAAQLSATHDGIAVMNSTLVTVAMGGMAEAGMQALSVRGLVLSRGERLSMFKNNLLRASKPQNPKDALSLINKTLDDVENVHAGINDRMYGILDDKFVTYHSNGNVTALTKGHRIEIQSNGSFSIFERKSGNLFLNK